MAGQNLAMTSDMTSTSWFGPDFVAEYRRKHGARSPEQRPLTYDIAVEDEYAPWRGWLDEQLAHLPASAAAATAGKIWLDKDFWTVNLELAVGAGLRAAGLTVEYEHNWNGVSPDWTILAKDGRPSCFVEVHTDNPPADTFARMRAWHALVQRIRQIPVGVVLQLGPGSPVDPPDAGTAKKIARELRTQLLQETTQAWFTSCGYTFLVMGDRHQQGRQMTSPWGVRACFNPPSEMAGVVDSQSLKTHVEEKVRKYRTLADDYGVPLVVAVGAHKFTGLSLEEVDHLINGADAPVITFQFNAGDQMVSSRPIPWGPVAPWTMPEELSELIWISNEFPFPLTRRVNPRARRAATWNLPADVAR